MYRRKQKILFLLSDYAFNEMNYSIPKLVEAIKSIPDLKLFVDNLSSDQLEGVKPIIEVFEESDEVFGVTTKTTLYLFFDRNQQIIYHDYQSKEENDKYNEFI